MSSKAVWIGSKVILTKNNGNNFPIEKSKVIVAPADFADIKKTIWKESHNPKAKKNRCQSNFVREVITDKMERFNTNLTLAKSPINPNK